MIPNPLSDIQGIAYIGSFENIAPTMSIDILVKPGIVENIQLGQTYSSKEVKLYKALFK